MKVSVKCQLRAFPLEPIQQLIRQLRNTSVLVISESEPHLTRVPRAYYTVHIHVELDLPSDTREPTFAGIASRRAPRRDIGVVGVQAASESRAALDLLQRRFMLAELRATWKSGVVGRPGSKIWEQGFHVKCIDNFT